MRGFSILVKQLKKIIEQLNVSSLITFSFDGEILCVNANEKTLIVQGKGKPWPEVAVSRLRN